jgi:signal transduction histidine kinase
VRRWRLRTKFLVVMLLTSAGLTAVSLVIVQRTVAAHIRHGLSTDLSNSVETFRDLEADRENDLSRQAELMADLPNLKALMSSNHPSTIQDGSREIFHLSGGDLFALINPAGQIMGFHTKPPGLSREQAQRLLNDRGLIEETPQWWFGDGHLYQVVLAPIYFGRKSQIALLGMVAVGYEMNAGVARQVGQVAASKVAILYGEDVVVSTLLPEQAKDLASHATGGPISAGQADWHLGRESFMTSALPVNLDANPSVTIVVMKSYDQATAFLNELRRLLLAVALGAVVVGTALAYFIAGTFTRPLEELVDGVRALGGGDYGYPVHISSASEVSELTHAFTRMRDSLREAQQRFLEAERLAIIGRMASSISHDLRHPLTAVLANAEFLAEVDLTPAQREELYLEIRVAVNRLTDLIDSLLELSRPAESLSLVQTPVEDSIGRAIELVRAHRQFHNIAVGIESSGVHDTLFDPRKMERVFYNLLLNSCQAAHLSGGRVAVEVSEQNGDLIIQIEDDGPGVESSIRDKLFQPFVSHGKENGTGLGLTIAQKIVQDHYGSLQLESSVPGRTIMRIVLPRTAVKMGDVDGNPRTTSQSLPNSSPAVKPLRRQLRHPLPQTDRKEFRRL